MKKTLTCAAVSALVLTVAAQAAPFTPGNLVVSRVGAGDLALSNAATPTFIEEFTLSGTFVQTIGLPTVINGNHRRFTNSGTATSEGFLTRSVDGLYLTLGGYDADVGLASVVSQTSANVNRVVARLDLNADIDTTTALTDTFSANNIRSVVSTNGTDLWLGGTGGSGNNGARYTTLGATTSTQLNSTNPTNLRVVNIYNGQLYTSSASGAFQGVSTVGTGLPTTSGQTITLLPGFPTTSGPSSYDYWFASDDIVYVADDRTVANGGGIQKWVYDSGTSLWSLVYTLNTDLNAGARGLVGAFDDTGAPILYATTTEASNNRLVTVTDLGVASSFTTLASAGANKAFRGVDFTPIPEPGTLALLGLGALLLIRRRA